MKMFHICVIQYNRFQGLCNCLFPQKDGENLYRFTKKDGWEQRKLYEIMFHIIVKHEGLPQNCLRQPPLI